MSRDKKLPALQFYPGDWRKAVDIQSLSFHDRGVWFEMLMLMHDSEQRGVLLLNGVAMPDEMIARAIGLDNQIFNQTLTTLLTYGVASREPNTGAVMSRRMVRDEGIRQIRTESGFKGGNPVLLKQNETTLVKQITTPSSSSSSSSSKPKKTSADAEEIYRAYPRKEAKGPALKAITKALNQVDKETLLRKVHKFSELCQKEGRERQFIPHPASWFNGLRWEDESLIATSDIYRAATREDNPWSDIGAELA